MSTKQKLGLIGSIILFVGVFMPIISLPMIGNVNYFNNGKGDGTIILILAVISFVLVLSKNYKWLWFTGLGSLGMLLFTFVTFQLGMSKAKAVIEAKLEGNVFRGLTDMSMQSFQIQWGWALLIVGAALVVASASLKEESKTESNKSSFDSPIELIKECNAIISTNCKTVIKYIQKKISFRRLMFMVGVVMIFGVVTIFVVVKISPWVINIQKERKEAKDNQRRVEVFQKAKKDFDDNIEQNYEELKKLIFNGSLTGANDLLGKFNKYNQLNYKNVFELYKEVKPPEFIKEQYYHDKVWEWIEIGIQDKESDCEKAKARLIACKNLDCIVRIQAPADCSDPSLQRLLDRIKSQ